MKLKQKNIHLFFILTIILLIGFILRMWMLAKIPAVLNRDEAALAYNAVLLKETGKDEWGKSWPLALESFGDYKLPGYPFLLVIFFSILGISDVVVKLPSVLAGTALIPLTYFFILKGLGWKKNYAVLGSLFIAVQPVFFFYSRIAFEANVALTLFILSMYLFLFTKRTFFHLCAATILLVSIFTYNTPLLLLPFLIPLFIWWKGVKNWREWLVPAASSFIICVIGFASLLSLAQQKSGITIFSDESTWMESVQFHNQYSGIAQKILGNKIVFYSSKILHNYLNSFSPVFLVEKGGSHPWHTLPGFGHIFWSVYLFTLLGIAFSIVQLLILIRRNKWHQAKINFLLLYLLFISLLPAVITVDAPHATRSLFFFFMLILFAIKGLNELFSRLVQFNLVKKQTSLILFFIAFAFIVFSAESVRYFYTYFTEYQQESASILKGGFDDILDEVQQKHSGPVAVIDGDGYQYILTAWYAPISSQEFFMTVQKHLPDKIGFRYGYKVGNYRFIVHEADKFSEEKTIVEWDEQVHRWQIKEMN